MKNKDKLPSSTPQSTTTRDQVGKPPVITIDGPSGSGKGTLAVRLAHHLGWHLLDSGALYRILGLKMLECYPELLNTEDDARIAAAAKNINIEFVAQGVCVSNLVSPSKSLTPILIKADGVDVTQAIRSEAVGNAASVVARLPSVREALFEYQLRARCQPGLVADGRDMGTVIFPDAILKFFLTASTETRGLRRFNQLQATGKDVSLREIVEDIRARDSRDTARKVAPLKPAVDAQVLDTTDLTPEEVFNEMQRHLRSLGFAY